MGRVSRWRTAASLALLLALTAGFYWKLTLSREWTFLEWPDLAFQVRPWLDFQAREIHAGRIPLWDPYEWGGHSLIGQVQPGVANPLNWILFAMPLRDGHIPIGTLHWYWVLLHWLGAVFMYALCRDLKCPHAASIFGGAIFALSGFVSHISWSQILVATAWIPLVLMFFLRVMRGERPRSNAAACGAALGMAFLGTHAVVPVFTAVLVGALWLWHVVEEEGKSADRAKHFAVFLTVWLAVTAAQALPSIEYGKQALRWAGAAAPLRWNEPVPFSVHALYSLGLKSILGIVAPGIKLYANPHVGVVVVGLALVAVWRRRKLRSSGWLIAVAVGGLLLALGKDFPPYWLLWQFVPMVEKAREPAYVIVLFHAGVAALAALGAAGLRRPWAVWLALALFMGEAVNNAPFIMPFDWPGSYTRMMESQRDIAQFLKSQPGWFRVDVDDNDVPYNFGDFYGVEQFGGYLASIPERTHRLLGGGDTSRLFGVQYHVGRTAGNAAQREVFQSRSGLKVFRDPRVAEPIWMHRAQPCPVADRLVSVSRVSGAAILQADVACPGLLVVGDAFYRGWRAYVDGRRVPIQEVSAIRAVQLGAGHHRVEFVYRPASVYYGFGAAVAGLLLTLALRVWDARGRSAPDGDRAAGSQRDSAT